MSTTTKTEAQELRELLERAFGVLDRQDCAWSHHHCNGCRDADHARNALDSLARELRDADMRRAEAKRAADRQLEQDPNPYSYDDEALTGVADCRYCGTTFLTRALGRDVDDCGACRLSEEQCADYMRKHPRTDGMRTPAAPPTWPDVR